MGLEESAACPETDSLLYRTNVDLTGTLRHREGDVRAGGIIAHGRSKVLVVERANDTTIDSNEQSFGSDPTRQEGAGQFV
jgi:hypothetical protein